MDRFIIFIFLQFFITQSLYPETSLLPVKGTDRVLVVFVSFDDSEFSNPFPLETLRVSSENIEKLRAKLGDDWVEDFLDKEEQRISTFKKMIDFRDPIEMTISQVNTHFHRSAPPLKD